MSSAPSRSDLVILTADRNCQFALVGLMTRHRSLGIRPITPAYLVHPQKDPGVLHGCHEFLRSYVRTYDHALVLMDREGCGEESQDRNELEARLEHRLRITGWDDRAAAVVIDPELEVWVWADSPHVPTELGWTRRRPDLWTWLRDTHYLKEGKTKPERPKEALEAVLREARKPRSSALYRSLAEKVGLGRCEDPSFLKLKAVLRRWFALR